MITKETAREIYNCYQQIEEIDKIKSDMVKEIERAREQNEEDNKPIPENGSFGKYGKGMQLGVPDGSFSSMRIFSISPTIGVMVMDEQKSNLEKRLRELETIAKLEMGKPII
ncbi:hypothetical protein [Parabacteroides sp. AM08-6]|uniref:hypothetical protein n=1 Tax=Parabacteroides sp. AM08-6 TaxID=2292053 RepID=UPI000EFDD76A|nr:hypothetical protein [Parabacteroides sp. AM08-6]RHJ83516.1 hypothetical protein DW103_07265 [Parabacteroides sp. AM08-6]